jgi:hypothetical protein
MAEKKKQLYNGLYRGGPNMKPGQPTLNPAGRAGSRMDTLISHALRDILASIDPASKEKKTYAQKIARLLINCATDPDPELDKTRIMALAEIIDRTEGRPKQQLDVNDVTAELRARSTEDLEFKLEKGYWPEEAHLQHKQSPPKIIDGGSPTMQ